MSDRKPKPPKPEGVYDIAEQFTQGLAAGISHSEPRTLKNTDHWIAGWDAGYAARPIKHAALNKYLVGIGREPLGIVRAI